MDIKEAYKVMQAAWVDLYDVKVGDTVRVLRVPKHYELGAECDTEAAKESMVGGQHKIKEIKPQHILLKTSDGMARNFPFFCLEKIKSKPHTIAFDGSEPVEVPDDVWEKIKKAMG